MKKFIITIVITCYCCCIHAQHMGSEICIQTMVSLQDEILHDNIEKKDVVDFWKCFEDCYDESIEILEFRNEILFTLLQFYPQLTLCTLQQQNVSIQNRVVSDLANPIHEGINLLKVYYNISTTKQVDNHMRECMLLGLQKAIDNNAVDNQE